MMIAALSGYEEIVIKLLDKGANVNAVAHVSRVCLLLSSFDVYYVIFSFFIMFTIIFSYFLFSFLFLSLLTLPYLVSSYSI